jgi:hypothetical protein
VCEGVGVKGGRWLVVQRARQGVDEKEELGCTHLPVLCLKTRSLLPTAAPPSKGGVVCSSNDTVVWPLLAAVKQAISVIHTHAPSPPPPPPPPVVPPPPAPHLWP